jgi:6-phosphogluconolactonase
MHPWVRILGIGAFTAMTLASSNGLGAGTQFITYVGTYTGAHSDGIYAYRFDTRTGKAEPLGLVARTVNPTFLAIHPDQQHLYAANEVGEWKGAPGGYVTSFRIDAASGKLTELNQQSTVGGGPCHVTVDQTGKALLAANYGGGSTVSFPLAPDGSIGAHAAFFQHVGSSVNPGRQKEPHAHSINTSPDNRFAFVADLGTDNIVRYGLNPAEGRLIAAEGGALKLPAGSGPRHLSFSPDGRFAYVINELLSTVGVLAYSPATGGLTLQQTISTLPPDFHGNSTTAEVRVHPNGHFVYGSNRGHDSLTVFRVEADGHLTRVENIPTGGKTPRNFNLDPTGRWLWAANQDSDSIFIFAVDGDTGHLTPTGQKLDVGSPVCIRFVPTAQ